MAAICSARKTRQQHHALAIPMFGPGHSNALMRLCQRLASQKGFVITFVSIDLVLPHQDLQQQKQREEMAAKHDGGKASSLSSAAAGLDIRGARITLLVPPPSGSTGMIEAFYLASQSMAPQIEQLLLRLEQGDSPVTCIISDLFMTGATQSVADKFKLPRIALNCFSQSVVLLFHHILQGTLSIEEVVEAVSKWESMKGSIFKEGLQGLPTLRVGDLMENLGENLFCYKFMSQALQATIEKAHALVVNSFEKIEHDAFKINLGLPVYPMGPLVMETIENDSITNFWKVDDACISWLDEQPLSSVLYISFGSFASISIQQFEELVCGLISSEQRFLWVFRAGLVKDVLYTKFPEDMLSKSNGRGYVTAWAPQVKVLEHPVIQGFLTHCGWNSTLEALANGVPMLCFPYFADQFMDTKLIVEQWKVGLRFEEIKGSRLVGREEVERVIKALMMGEEGKFLRENANLFKELCQQNCSQGGQVSEHVRSLVMSIE